MNLEDIKNWATISHQGVNPSVSLSKKEFDWLIKQAEIQQETELLWSKIENDEVEIEPNDFYSVYQDIAMKHYER